MDAEYRTGAIKINDPANDYVTSKSAITNGYVNALFGGSSN